MSLNAIKINVNEKTQGGRFGPENRPWASLSGAKRPLNLEPNFLGQNGPTPSFRRCRIISLDFLKSRA